ncbi:MAG: hypothetical protein WC384_02465 [Prolixibacteraceae bacterium]|jgi:hypothetical protein
MKTKNLFKACFILFLFVGISACDLLKDKEETDPEKTMGKVGNYWSANVPGVGSTTVTIDENSGGNVIATIPYNGVNYEVEGKVTDTGIYDYVYSNGDKSKPFTLVKFDANVGDKWEYKVGNQTVTREVVKKSTTDDTSYQGFWMIKTIDVMETIPSGFTFTGGVFKLKSGSVENPDNAHIGTMVNSGTSQVKSILWKFNHKYGFISAQITKTDNSTVTVNQNDTNVEM